MSLASQGLLDPYQAFALTLGANLGTAINPVVEGQSGADLSARRVPIGNLLTRIVGILVAFVFLDQITGAKTALDGSGGRMVANFHTGVNLIVALVFMPVLPPFPHATRFRSVPFRLGFFPPV